MIRNLVQAPIALFCHGDPELLARGVPSVDLLKVAHHGSGTASTPAAPKAGSQRS